MLFSALLRRSLGADRLRRLALALLSRLPDRDRAIAVERLLARPAVVETPHGPIRFLNHGRGSLKRAETLMTKEPDSLAWIDRMAPGSLFWDIGANVGVLSLYAAARRDLQVWAFEPAAVNFYDLAANCELNDAEPQLRCLQLGFAEREGLQDLHVSQALAARSFTFRQKADRPGRHKPVKRYPSRQTVQLWTIDGLIERYGLDCPNYVKIDVPGLTPEILRGARRTLARPELRELQVEAREDGKGGRRVAALLAPLGFEIAHRNRRADGSPGGDLVFARRGALPRRPYADAAD